MKFNFSTKLIFPKHFSANRRWNMFSCLSFNEYKCEVLHQILLVTCILYIYYCFCMGLAECCLVIPTNLESWFQMHCSSFEIEGSRMEEGEVLVAIAALVTEGRIPGKSTAKSRGFYEGPHCPLNKTSTGHTCNPSEPLVSYPILEKNYCNLTWKFLPN